MNSAGYRAEVVSAYQTAGGAPYLDYTDTVLGQVYEGMDVVDTIAQVAVDENQKPTETITINSVNRAVRPATGHTARRSLLACRSA